MIEGWDSVESMLADFYAPKDALDGCKLLYAEYEQYSYEGYAFVVYDRGGKLYEVHGSHCSCFGLEDQWTPEETTAAALLMRPKLPAALRDALAGYA